MPTLVDTHCHIHETSYPLAVDEVMARAHDAGVGQMICVGTNVQSSRDAVVFASKHQSVYATVGVHPHDTSAGVMEVAELAGESRVVAIGEVGLDYFYMHSPREVQMRAFELQLQMAYDHKLPVVFHVREAFEDFWPIVDNFSRLKGGVLHSFTGDQADMRRGVERGFYIGVNGISTFTKDPLQREMFAAIPLSNMLLETDAPFLTPTPFRGKVNEPSMVREVGAFQASLRNVPLEELAHRTTANAAQLFAIG